MCWPRSKSSCSVTKVWLHWSSPAEFVIQTKICSVIQIEFWYVCVQLVCTNGSVIPPFNTVCYLQHVSKRKESIKKKEKKPSYFCCVFFMFSLLFSVSRSICVICDYILVFKKVYLCVSHTGSRPHPILFSC